MHALAKVFRLNRSKGTSCLDPWPAVWPWVNHENPSEWRESVVIK